MTLDVIKLFRPDIIRSNKNQKLNNFGMVKNYYTMAFRSVKKNRINTAINVFGIAIGMAAALLIVQYTSLEFSFDDFHAKKDRIFRVDRINLRDGVILGRRNSTPYQLGPEMTQTIPGIEKFTRVHPVGDGAVVTYSDNGVVSNQFFEEERALLFVDHSFFEMFDFELLLGTEASLLTGSKTVVITEHTRDKYFGEDVDPTGKFLEIDGGRAPGTYKVTGLLNDLPQNTRFADAEFFLSMEDLLKAEQYKQGGGWNWKNFVSYIQLSEKADINAVEGEVVDILNNRSEDEDGIISNVVLSPLAALHLRDETKTGGLSEEQLQLFLIIAFFIVVVAWLNYINLSTAQAMQRAKEVGIRKVIGALRVQLLQQFLFEAMIINLFGLILAFALAYAFLPVMGDITGKVYSFGTGITLQQWLILLFIFVAGTFLSGFYPAFVLARFNIAIVIKGVTSSRVRKFGLRQVLVTFQLLIAIFLISGTWTVYRQLDFMQSQDLGLEVDKVLAVRGPFVYEDWDEKNRKLEVFRTSLLEMSGVEKVSLSRALPGGEYNWGTEMTSEEVGGEEYSIQLMFVDEHFKDTYNMELIAGRFHQQELQAVEHQVVVNETLLRKFNLGSPEEAIGKSITDGTNKFPIIGVLKDYHWNSLKEKKVPTLFYYDGVGNQISIKMASSNISTSLVEIEEQYRDLFAGNPFDYQFVDDFFNAQYESDQRFRQLFTSFSGIAVLIACLGLFGLASFTVSLRVKEIGIRKVLGARIFSILAMLFKDYLLLVLIAAMVGIPVLYLTIDKWLGDFAYRINITADLFLIPLLLLMVIMILTIGYQSVTAARSNPVDSLRSE